MLSSFVPAIVLYASGGLMPERYQSHDGRTLAQGSTLLAQNSENVGTGLFSRIPTSPFASDVRCAASIWRATLSLPCFVRRGGSRTIAQKIMAWQIRTHPSSRAGILSNIGANLSQLLPSE